MDVSNGGLSQKWDDGEPMKTDQLNCFLNLQTNHFQCGSSDRSEVCTEVLSQVIVSTVDPPDAVERSVVISFVVFDGVGAEDSTEGTLSPAALAEVIDQKPVGPHWEVCNIFIIDAAEIFLREDQNIRELLREALQPQSNVSRLVSEITFLQHMNCFILYEVVKFHFDLPHGTAQTPRPLAVMGYQFSLLNSFHQELQFLFLFVPLHLSKHLTGVVTSSVCVHHGIDLLQEITHLLSVSSQIVIEHVESVATRFNQLHQGRSGLPQALLDGFVPQKISSGKEHYGVHQRVFPKCLLDDLH
ncbi:hypothetical protein DNTS_022117 [Danionella cerebrum]|uniref:Uncharacterized protein n=1 Tax=Danionella cerebrum TaxID=2873325 RepID=A0A553R0K7_9TELE|nr:hypothetical protein DNTS_022117 [Danionella translucida]